MMKLLIGNRTYSSWSLRGWLIAKLSGLPFEIDILPLDTAGFAEAAADPLRLPSGRVPTLWADGTPVWDSLAILGYLEELVGRSKFWPDDPEARAHARSTTAEMHSGFASLRRECPMHLRLRSPIPALSDPTAADLSRIDQIWTEARTRYGQGGPFLYGQFSAADAFYAPVVTRARTYDLPLSKVASSYREAVIDHPWMQEWQSSAESETWLVDRFEKAAKPG